MFVIAGGYYRSESRGGDYRNGGHDSRFRSDFSSSNNNLAAPVTTTIPVTQTRESYSRSASRSSRREFTDGPNGYYSSEVRSSSRGPGDFRSSSRGPGDYRSETLLRPGNTVKIINQRIFRAGNWRAFCFTQQFVALPAARNALLILMAVNG